MKRVGFLYEKMIDSDAIKKAIKNAAKGKTTRRYVKVILDDLDGYTAKIKAMLKSQTVELSPNRYIEIYDNSCQKKRQITIPKFYPDQIIHWLVVTALMPVLTRGMYRYTCGSVPNRGGMDAKGYVEKAIRDKKMRYCAKMDISKFFDSVKPQILLDMLGKKIKDDKMLDLVAKILKNGGDKLPIGYYTSQWFSNFYLEELDHYIKEELKIKYYVRYVDDIVMIDSNKRKLHKAIKKIDEYLRTIGLKLKDNWQVWAINSRPIDFVGFRFYGDKTLLRKKIFFRLCRRVRTVKKSRHISAWQAMSILSLIGWLKHINARNFYKACIYPYTPKNKLKKIVSNYSKGVNQWKKKSYLAAN